MKRLPLIDFLSQSGGVPILDVRAPLEYINGHIPGAYNFPLFSDEERIEIGTLYKKKGKQQAIKKGLQIVGPKMLEFVEKAESFHSKKLMLYCWRGGMRSEAMAWLLNLNGFMVSVLEGGYKTYRKEVLSRFDRPLNLIVLTGLTGSKKTLVLKMLKASGSQVIDLEELAGHQGSSFGNQKSSGQPSSEHFHNLLFTEISKLNLDDPIWVEDESQRLGLVHIPDGLFRQMQTAAYVRIDVSLADRIVYLIEEYGQLPEEKLLKATRSIAKRLGPQKTKEALDALSHKEFAKAAEIILSYYDKKYEKTIAEKGALIKFTINCTGKSVSETSNLLINWQQQMFKTPTTIKI